MFFAISNAVKKRLTLVFQDIFLQHPVFKKVEVFTKFPKEDRPKHALLIRSVSGSSQKLSFDNFGRTARQFSSLANLKCSTRSSGNSIEWVRDDDRNIDKISAPGYYIVKMITDRSFIVEPYLTVYDEELEIEFIENKKGSFLDNQDINPNSEYIYTDTGLYLKPDIHYTIDYAEGKVLFQDSFDPDEYEAIYIDYQIIGDPTEEYPIDFYEMNNTAIPGVIMAFGDRLRKDDEQVVIIEKERRDVAKVFTGRWQLSCDLMGVSQDDDQQERLVDYAISEFWANWQDKLVNEGVNCYDFSLSGESEDLEVEVPEEYFYTGGISFTVETDWELHVPLISEVRKISLEYGNEGLKETMTDVKEAGYDRQGQMGISFDSRMKNSGHDFGLQIAYPTEAVVMRPAPPLKVKSKRYLT